MTCDTVLPMIEEYFDGELDATARRTVDAHLAACSACTAEFAALEREHLLYARYDRGFEPSPDMWSAVRSRIAEEAGQRGNAEGWFRSLTAWLGSLMTPSQLVPAGAAALALVLTVSLAMMWRDQPALQSTASNDVPPSGLPPVPPPPPVVTPAPISLPPAPVVAPPSTPPLRRPKPPVVRDERLALPAPVADAERRYLQAIALLTKDIERSSAGADTASRDDWSKPLEALDRNIDAARRAVQKNPDDPTAVLSMLSAYDSKVETLQTMAILQASNDR
jgi:hypothetical protein